MRTAHKFTHFETPDYGTAAAIGTLSGLMVSSVTVAIAGLPLTAPVVAVWVLHAACAAIGAALGTTLLADDAPPLPMRSVLRYLALALPAFLVLEWAYGGQVLSFASWTIPTDAFVGFRVVMAATLAAVGLPVLESELEKLESDAEFSTDRESTYQRAIERLAAIDVAIESTRRSEELELARFDARLQRAVECESRTRFEFNTEEDAWDHTRCVHAVDEIVSRS